MIQIIILQKVLNLIIIQFGNKNKYEIEEKRVDSIENLLSEIDKLMLQRKSQSIYIKKQIKYFEGDSIYIIKPNQRRFWSRSMAINDAKELIGEILMSSY